MSSAIAVQRSEPPVSPVLSTGCEWVVDAFDCEPERLRQLDVLRTLCERILGDLSLHVVGTPQWHQFPGEAGVTGLYLLSESHLACHTYPEHGLATFNLYCCRRGCSWSWEAELSRALGASRVRIVEVVRGNPQDGRVNVCGMDHDREPGR